MTPIFKKSSEIVYLTQRTPAFSQGNYDVILSPEFYWVKKLHLPVTKISAAKKLADSIFEGSLPAGTYAYDVSKSGDAFVMIAYEKEKISKLLNEKFDKEARVHGVYFAQHEFGELVECCGVDIESSLVNINGLIMQIPRVCTESKNEVESFLDGKKLSNNKLSLGSLHESIIGSRELVLMSVGIGLLFIALSADWINYKKATSGLTSQKEEIVKTLALPQTSMQLNSIKQSLTKTHQAQKTLRDQIFGLQSLVLKSGEYIESINTDAKETTVVLKLESKAREDAVKAELSKSLKIKSADFLNNNLTLKIMS